MFMDKFMDAGIYQYIHEFVKLDNPYLKKVEYKGNILNNTDMSVGKEVGKFLGMLVHMKQAKNVLEIGTCIGYSSVWIATALSKTGGKLTSIEYDKQFCDLTQKHIVGAGLSEYQNIIFGNATEEIKKLEGSYDIVFQDSDKSLYVPMLEDCIRLVKVGGIIVVDDTLFKVMGVTGTYSDDIEKYNAIVKEDDRLYSMILPIGSGITVSVRLK